MFNASELASATRVVVSNPNSTRQQSFDSGSKIDIQPGPRRHDSSTIVRRHLIKYSSRRIDVRRLTPRAPINNRQIHASLLASFLIPS